MREDRFGDLDRARFEGESRGGVRGEAASATTHFGDGLLRGLLRNARDAGIENPEYDHGGIPLDGQDGSCNDSVTSSKFDRRNLPILTSDRLNPVFGKLTFGRRQTKFGVSTLSACRSSFVQQLAAWAVG